MLNHVSGTKGGVAGTYNLYQYRQEKQEALQAWADHVEGAIGGPLELASFRPADRNADGEQSATTGRHLGAPRPSTRTQMLAAALDERAHAGRGGPARLGQQLHRDSGRRAVP